MANYKDLISKDEKAVKAEEVEIRVKEASIQLDYDILAATKTVNQCTNDLKVAQSKCPGFSPKEVLEAKHALKEANEDLSGLMDMKTEMFS